MDEIAKYSGFYQDIYNITGDEKLIEELHKLYWSDTIKMPKHLYNSEYVTKLVSEVDDIRSRREIAKSHGYPYDTISKKIRELQQNKNNDNIT